MAAPRRDIPRIAVARAQVAGLNMSNSLDAAADADQAAELGLAEAVLALRQPDSAGFERYAQAAITARLQRLGALSRNLGHPVSA